MGGKRIAVIGSGGLVGQHAAREFARNSYEVVRISRSSADSDFLVDAGDAGQLSHAIERAEPDVVVNAVKCPFSTDEAEGRKAETWRANVDVPGNLALLQRGFGFLLVHISSDWIFEGRDGETYSESSIPNPRNFYSFTKAVAEERVRSISERHLILRPGGVFGRDSRGTGIFMRMKKSIDAGEPFMAPADQFSQPIWAGELAKVIRMAVDKGAEGTYNSVGRDYVSRHGLAVAICESFGWDRRMALPSASVRPIEVPKHLRLDISKLESGIKRMPSLIEQLDAMRGDTG